MSTTEMADPALAQRQQALGRANEIRTKRRILKEELKDGQTTIRSVLEDAPWYLATAKLDEVLAWAPGIGPSRAVKLIRAIGIGRVTVKFGALSEATRHRLIKEYVAMEARRGQ